MAAQDKRNNGRGFGMKYLPEKDLFRPDEVAAYFGYTRKTIYRWIEVGKLTAVRIANNQLRIQREAILKIQKPS